MKKLVLSIILVVIVGLTAAIVNHTESIVHTRVYQNMALLYGQVGLFRGDSAIVYDPGLRRLPSVKKPVQVYACMPEAGQSYRQQMEDFIDSGAGMVVECSGLDAWHTSREGSAWLPVLRERAYRAVIFDGGHHLPTLGLAPDIIIVPVFRGYAVHGYMRDGIRTEKIREILAANHIPTVMVTVSRWGLVKTQASMQKAGGEILKRLKLAAGEGPPLTVNCRPRISKCGENFFIYINGTYAKRPDLVTEYCRQLQPTPSSCAYMAFDYNAITPVQAEEYAGKLALELGIKTEIVNEPVKVGSLLWPKLRL